MTIKTMMTNMRTKTMMKMIMTMMLMMMMRLMMMMMSKPYDYDDDTDVCKDHNESYTDASAAPGASVPCSLFLYNMILSIKYFVCIYIIYIC